MVKKTTYDHHPVEILKGFFIGGSETHITAIALALQTANLVGPLTDQDDQLPWGVWNINVLAAAAGITVPSGAVGAIIDVTVNDSGSAANPHHMKFAPAGVLYAASTIYVYCGRTNDEINTRLVPILWTEEGDFAYGRDASGTNFDYTIKIVAWLMAGSDYTPPEIPSQELACGFRVNQ